MADIGKAVPKGDTGRWVYITDDLGNTSEDDFATPGDAEKAGTDYVNEQAEKERAAKIAARPVKAPGLTPAQQQAAIDRGQGRW